MRFGIVGSGNIARAHAHAAQSVDGIRIVAAADTDAENRGRFCGENDVPGYESYEEMIQKARTDAVLIALPHSLHCPAVKECAALGQHILLEKPMAVSVAECREMIEAARGHRVKLYVGHSAHHAPTAVACRKLIEEDRIGTPVMGLERRYEGSTYFNRPDRPWFLRRETAGGGILMNVGVHSLDTLLFLARSRVRRVRARVGRHRADFDIEGNGMVLLHFDGGFYATIMQSGYTGPGWKETEIVGTDGMLKIRDFKDIFLSTGGDYEDLHFDTPYSECLPDQLRTFLRYVRDEDEPYCTPEYAMHIVDVIQSAYVSSETGQEIAVG